MRHSLTLSVLLACAVAFAGCMQRTVTTDAGNANATTNANTAGGSNANAAQTNGASQGVGPHGQGIGGTSETNRNSAAGGNTNVEPAGVNRNVGATPAPNRNR